jgi:hypothetical protein
MVKIRETKIESWDQFVTRNLTVEYALMGNSHIFPYQGATVRITLPKSNRVVEHYQENALADVYAYREENDEKVLLQININGVDVCVQQGHVVALPGEVFNRRPKATDLISEVDQKRLDAIGTTANNIASNAFEYWLSVLRWKCNNYGIGRPMISDNRSGWSTYLRDAESQHDVWMTPRTMLIFMRKAVTAEDWDSIQAALESGDDAPIYSKLLDDAREYRDRHEYRRSTIDLAIACEVFIRMMVLQSLPQNLDPDVRVMIEEANINQYVRKFFPNLLTIDGQAKFKKLANDHLGSLFDARNKIMHMAQDDRATNENCLRFIKATETLFEIGKMTV